MVEAGLDRSADVLTRGFADYYVAIPFSSAALLQLARTDSVDFAASRIVLRDGTPAGAALIARRGWTSRLAGMSLLPDARRQGIGRALVMHLLAEAKARGERAMVLEVIEQNEPAVRLYENCGFRKVRRLVGYAAEPAPEPAEAPSLEEIDLRAMAAFIVRDDLPWQVSAENVANLTPPSRAFRLSGAVVAITPTASGDIAVRAVAESKSAPDTRAAAELLSALRRKFPGRRCEIKAVWPEELGEIFSAAGFTRTALTQWQMARDV